MVSSCAVCLIACIFALYLNQRNCQHRGLVYRTKVEEAGSPESAACEGPPCVQGTHCCPLSCDTPQGVLSFYKLEQFPLGEY